MTDGPIDLADLRRLVAMIGGEQEDLDELLEEYEEVAPALAAKIRAAGEAGDWEAMRIAAHTLKSNARSFGAVRLAALCESLERECRTGSVEDPLVVAAAIEAEERAARQALSSLKPDDVGAT